MAENAHTLSKHILRTTKRLEEEEKKHPYKAKLDKIVEHLEKANVLMQQLPTKKTKYSGFDLEDWLAVQVVIDKINRNRPRETRSDSVTKAAFSEFIYYAYTPIKELDENFTWYLRGGETSRFEEVLIYVSDKYFGVPIYFDKSENPYEDDEGMTLETLRSYTKVAKKEVQSSVARIRNIVKKQSKL